jgi:hypothetical protein
MGRAQSAPLGELSMRILALVSPILMLCLNSEAAADLKLREIRGKVTEVKNADAASRKKGLPATMVVEAEKEKLKVTVPVKTLIFKKDGKALKVCKIEDLTEGCQLRVVYIRLEGEKKSEPVKARSVEILSGLK